MKKSLIAQSVTAVIAGLAFASGANALVVGPSGAASAPVNASPGVTIADSLVVNTDGIGHINLVPYYTVQSGYDTYVNIVNTDMLNGKAVKVRFRGASNSDDVFDFTLLLSPGDKFGFALTKDAATGLPMLAKAGAPNDDTSCTLGGTTGNGINKINGEKFVTARLNQRLTGDALANEAREGYVEILNMADIPPNTVSTSLFAAIKHVKNADGKFVAPCTPANLAVMAGNPTSYNGAADATSAVAKGLEVPTTGLITNWTVINVAKAAAYTGAAVAVEARDSTTGKAGFGNVVMFAQNNFAMINSGADPTTRYTSDPVIRGGFISAANYDFPDLSTPYLNDALDGTGIISGLTRPYTQASNLTASLAVTSVANEFVTFAGLQAKTDWIFSFPTRRYNIAVTYGATAAADTIRWSDLSAGPVIAGFTPVNYFVQDTAVAPAPSNGNVVKNPDEPTKTYQLCVTGIGFQNSAAAAALKPYTSAVTNNFDEWLFAPGVADPTFVISPSVPGVAPTLAFCGEVAVFKFNVADAAAPSVLGATVATKSLTMPYDNGWTRLSTPGLGAALTTGAGLPIIGSSVTELNNTGAAGAGYGQTFPHRTTRP